jgi:hypothetical protein
MILAKLAASITGKPIVILIFWTQCNNVFCLLLLLLLYLGFMILAKLAASITGKPFITLVRELFPTNTTATPIFGASDTGDHEL